MFHRLLSAVAVVFTIASTPAGAATVTVTVTDSKGAPAANAVVTLDGAALASRVPERNVIDQRHETFLPLVVVVRKGGSVVFTNNDATMHQVYSFSSVKQFQFEIDKGQVSKPVVFDKQGVAAIGCNIHDNMVAYVFVADAPFAAITDASGRVEFKDVPGGPWRVSTWHPQLRVGKQPLPAPLEVTGAQAELRVMLPLSAAPSMHMHKSDY